MRYRKHPVYCPECGWKMMEAVKGIRTQTSIPYKGRYPDIWMKCGHCGKEIGITKIE